MAEPFWRRSLVDLTYQDLAAFVDERIRENIHIEYKLPTYNSQSQKFEFKPEFLETVVAFANTDGGMILCGIGEDDGKRPATIEGIRVGTGKQRRDPAQSLRDMCASQIEATVTLDTRSIEIPREEDNAGNVVLLVRVRRGLLTPYNLRDHGIFIRNDDMDRQASVREVQALFARRAEATPQEELPWSRVQRQTFVPAQHIPTLPPFLMIALTPAFPIEPIDVNEQTDERFQELCWSFFNARDYILRERDGVVFDPQLYNQSMAHPPYACAYADGSIGARINVAPGLERQGDRRDLNFAQFWASLRRMLLTAARWPHGVCAYGGPLLCRIAVSNLADTTASIPGDVGARIIQALRNPTVPNRLPVWSITTELDPGSPIDEQIERILAPLARQLQFAAFGQLKGHIREFALKLS